MSFMLLLVCIFPILAYLHRADEDGESENVLPATESTKHIRQSTIMRPIKKDIIVMKCNLKH